MEPGDLINAPYNPRDYHLLQERIEATNVHRPTRKLSKDGDQTQGAKSYIRSSRWTKLSPSTNMDGADAIQDDRSRQSQGKHHM
jgi:hypothetical protein